MKNWLNRKINRLWLTPKPKMARSTRTIGLLIRFTSPAAVNRFMIPSTSKCTNEMYWANSRDCLGSRNTKITMPNTMPLPQNFTRAREYPTMAEKNSCSSMIPTEYRMEPSMVQMPWGITSRTAALKLTVENSSGIQITLGFPRSSMAEKTVGTRPTMGYTMVKHRPRISTMVKNCTMRFLDFFWNR